MARRIILHIGHAKTGTTTLQRTLVASRSVLLSKGFLHPDTAPHKHNHKALIPYLVASEDQQNATPEIAEARTLWQAIVQQVERDNPHTVVLSSEQLFRAWNPNQMSALWSKLRAIADDLTVIVYVREPAGLALSLLQQSLKSQPFSVTGLKLPNPRPALEAFRAAGFDTLRVRTFDRSTLEGGSVVDDFLANALPEFDLSELVVPLDKNTSMSAEAMDVLEDIQSGKRRLRFGKPRREVPFVDRQLEGFAPPRLVPEIRDAIRASFEHYAWLEETFGVVFPSADRAAMNPSKALAHTENAKRLQDILVVDTKRKALLWRKLSRMDATLRRLFFPC